MLMRKSDQRAIQARKFSLDRVITKMVTTQAKLDVVQAWRGLPEQRQPHTAVWAAVTQRLFSRKSPFSG